MRRIAWTTMMAGALLLAACGGDKKKGDGEGRKDLEAGAAAALGSGEDEKTKAAREADEAKRKEAFAERKAKEEAEKAAYEEKMNEIITLPEKMPKNVKTACKDLLDAYHEFILKSYEGDDGAILDWYNNRKAEELGARRGKCVKIDSLEATACQIHALNAAPPKWREKELEIISRCVQKYAPEKAEAAAKADAEELARRTKKAEAAGDAPADG